MLSNNQRELLKKLRKQQKSAATHLQTISGSVMGLWMDAQSCQAKDVYPERWTPQQIAVYATKIKIYAEVIPVLRQSAEEIDTLLRAKSCSEEQWDDFIKRNKARSYACAIKLEEVQEMEGTR
jgi:hypothetical protein